MILTTAQQMKTLDQRTIEELGVPGRVLMENAGRGLVQVILKEFPGLRSAAIVAGKGNNGGDGWVAARYLQSSGIRVAVFQAGRREALKGDAAANALLAERLEVPIVEMEETMDRSSLAREISGYELIVDALLGTGLEKEVRGFFGSLIGLINGMPQPKVAVDIPSGLSSDSGRPLGCCVQADQTVTFGLPKIGQVLYPGCRYSGRLFVVDIGIPPSLFPPPAERVEWLESGTVRSLLPRREPEGHKGTYGHCLILAGSTGKTGAAALAGIGALRSGAGLVTVGIPESLNPILEIKLTEAMTEPLAEGEPGRLGLKALDRIEALIPGKRSLALGPGLSTSAETRKLVQEILNRKWDLPLVIDADGLNALAENPGLLNRVSGRAVLTPHPGEMARLTGKTTAEIQADRIAAGREFARRFGVVLVLKGARTVVAAPEGPVYINSAAHPVLASGGMGDVLTGLIAGLMAQGLEPIQAACAGVHLHGLAGLKIAQARGDRGIAASELAEWIPALISGKEGWPPSTADFLPLVQEIIL